MTTSSISPLYEAIRKAAGLNLRLENGASIHISVSGAAEGKMNVVILAASEQQVEDALSAVSDPGRNFTLPGRVADGVWCSMGRV